MESPFFQFAPRDPVENVRWRMKLRRAALHDHDIRSALRQAAFDDPLFFFSAFMWLIEPRGKHKIIPFCPWDMQLPAIETLVDSVQAGAADLDSPIDVIFDKSRARGATWICLGVLLWFWLKDPMFSGGIISRNLEAVDKRNDLGALMPKIDWEIGKLPFWLLPVGFQRQA